MLLFLIAIFVAVYISLLFYHCSHCFSIHLTSLFFLLTVLVTHPAALHSSFTQVSTFIVYFFFAILR